MPGEGQQTTGIKASSPLGAELHSEDTRLIIGETTKLTLVGFISDFVLDSDPEYKASNVIMEFELPDSFEYVSGDISWKGQLEGNQKKEIEVIIKAKENTGNFQVSGTVIDYITDNNFMGGRSSLKICVVNLPEESCAEEVKGTRAGAEQVEETTELPDDFTPGKKS